MSILLINNFAFLNDRCLYKLNTVIFISDLNIFSVKIKFKLNEHSIVYFYQLFYYYLY